jgi:hypothetical protein
MTSDADFLTAANRPVLEYSTWLNVLIAKTIRAAISDIKPQS